jgi:hypothetical protein
MNGKNNVRAQEKASNELLEMQIHWSKQESQLKPFNSTCLKVVARGETRAARDSHFCERACKEAHHCNKSETKTNILTS